MGHRQQDGQQQRWAVLGVEEQAAKRTVAHTLNTVLPACMVLTLPSCTVSNAELALSL
jgi:hypothetical protein